MKVEYNKQVYRVGNGYCLKCVLGRDKCIGDIVRCFLFNKNFVYYYSSQLFEL